MNRLTIGVTGHRDIVPGEIETIATRVREFFSSLKSRFPVLDLELITPLAEGSDRLVTRVADEMGIPYTALLPMPADEYRNDFSGESSKREFDEMLRGAERVITLPGRIDGDVQSVEGRNWHYAQLGVFLSNHCQILLALWDGKESRQVGGTAHVVRYHLTAVMPGFHDVPPPASLLANNENDLTYHISVSRDRPEGGLPEGVSAGQARWITSHFSHSEDEQIPYEYGVMLDRLGEFNADCRSHAGTVDLESDGLLQSPPDAPVPPGARLVDSTYAMADRLAMYYQQRVNRGLLAMHVLAVIMGLVFIIYSESGGPNWLLAAFLALFFAGVALHVVGNSRQWHRKYLDYRALAEALRVQFYWNVAGVVDARSPGFAYDTFLHKQDVELGWIRHVMRTASAHRERGVDPPPQWLSWTIENWVGSEENASGQLGYYASKSVRNHRKYQNTRRLGTFCLWVGISLAVVMLLVGENLSPAQQTIVMILMGTLPLIAGVREAWSGKKAEKELIKQYTFMSKVFSNARKLLDGASDPVFQKRVLRALGEAALEEGAEWILMHRERPMEHSGL